jgi:aldehyde dehydrogenase (NAD+)
MEESLIKDLFAAQQDRKLELRREGPSERIQRLKRLKQEIQRSEEELFRALNTDLRKCRFEGAVTELYFTYAEIDHAISRLRRWMKPKRATASPAGITARHRIICEPKGVCLIIAPWNYPFQLMMSPLVSAIAAGNCAILKPSELSPATATVISGIISRTFQTREIACVEGDAGVSQLLLALPFDHIFFTGSTEVGKIVMAAASKHLSSVTLELGGKSPVVVDEQVNLEKAAETIAWGKLVNAGQTCIAPDYLLIHESRAGAFLQLYQKACQRLFFKDGKINTSVYGRIINRRHFDRISGLIRESVAGGAVLAWGGETDEASLTIHPTVLTGVASHHPVMKEELFGPVLPVITYQQAEEAIRFINARPKPLALYIFSEQKKFQNKIIRETSAGGTCVNDVLVQVSNPHVPFGGVNHSGTGSSHGIYGFRAFSHERTVMYQSRLALSRLIYPPYEKKGWLLAWLKKLM